MKTLIRQYLQTDSPFSFSLNQPVHRNRLVSAHETGKDDWAATYDYNNRIATRQVGTTTTTMIYDDLGRLLAEIDEATGKPKYLYSYDAVGLWAQTIYSPSTDKLRTVYPLFDGLGSTLGTVDGSGRDLDQFSYGAYGEEAANASQQDLPFRYTGRWGGYTDGRLGMVLNWHRWYGPTVGQWGSRDPIRQWGGLNLYVYVGNAPQIYVDVTGYFSIFPPNPNAAFGGMVGGALGGALSGGIPTLGIGAVPAAFAGAVAGGIAGGWYSGPLGAAAAAAPGGVAAAVAAASVEAANPSPSMCNRGLTPAEGFGYGAAVGGLAGAAAGAVAGAVAGALGGPVGAGLGALYGALSGGLGGGITGGLQSWTGHP